MHTHDPNYPDVDPTTGDEAETFQPDPPTLLARIRELVPSAESFNRGRLGTEDEAEYLHGDDGIVVITEDRHADDGSVLYLLGLYSLAQWNGDEDGATTFVEDVTAEQAATIVGYLATWQPEETDWLAWAAQRLDDEGPTLGADAYPGLHFLCSACGYTTSEPYSVAVLNDLAQTCPQCDHELTAADFTRDEATS